MAKKIEFNEIKEYCAEAYEFLTQFDLKDIPLGRYNFTNSAYMNVEEYSTFDERIRRYEAHKRYIDIQIIAVGKEYIKVGSKNSSIVSKYSQEKDIVFYANVENEKSWLMNAGEYLVLEPEDIHMPCVKVNESEYVKKIVIKVPVKVNKNLSALVMDVDGTLTDGKIVHSNEGELLKSFNVKDGMGLKLGKELGIEPMILTSRESKIVANRAKELGIVNIYQGVKEKIKKLEELYPDFSSIAYIGDDVNDLDCMLKVKEAGGLVGCPLDAVDEVIEIADFVAPHKGGEGAVRDFVEFIRGK